MLKAWLLRTHRWVALIFALPLLVVVGTGLVLSFEPIIQAAAVKPGSLAAEQLIAPLQKFDPAGKARGFSIDPRLGVMTIQGVGADGSIDVNLSTGEQADVDSALDDVFSQARRLHQRLILRMRWLVTTSAFVMLALAAIGLGMGFSRLRNNWSGWHKGVAWFVLPLVVLSPLTGVLIAFNVGFSNPGGGPGGANARAAGRGAPRAAATSLAEATKLATATVDPSTILSLGTRGGRLLVRVVKGGEIGAYAVSGDGVVAQPTNWPRNLHVGAGLWTGLLNVIASLAILALLVTGLTIWGGREARLRKIRRSRQPPACAAEPAE